jgi:beta-lactamase class D
MSKSLFALLLVPLFFTACSPNNVTVDNSLQRYFDSAGVKGSFGFFDNMHGHFTIYNLSRYRDSLYQPAATFDIIQSLIAIQSGVAKDENSLHQAFQGVSDTSLLVFRELAQHIGKDSLKKWVNSLGYGNKNIGSDTTAFWANNALKITSDEQLGLLKKLYFDQLPFFQRPQQLVCHMFPSEATSNYKLTYKTGQGIKEDGHAIGWIMGWVEENKHPYFFVINLESPDSNKNLSETGLAIAKNILLQLGFFKGKK